MWKRAVLLLLPLVLNGCFTIILHGELTTAESPEVSELTAKRVGNLYKLDVRYDDDRRVILSWDGQEEATELSVAEWDADSGPVTPIPVALGIVADRPETAILLLDGWYISLDVDGSFVGGLTLSDFASEPEPGSPALTLLYPFTVILDAATWPFQLGFGIFILLGIADR